MNRLTIPAKSLACVLSIPLLTSCLFGQSTQKEQATMEVHIKGTFANNDLDGKSIILMQDGKGTTDNLGSTIIKGNTFVFDQAFKPDTIGAYSLMIGKSVPIILEAGNIEVDFSKSIVSGTPLNDKLSQFSSKIMHYGDSINSIIHGLKENEKEKRNAIFNEYSHRMIGFFEQALKSNPRNAIATQALQALLGSYEPTKTMDKQLNEWISIVSPEVLKQPSIEAQLTTIKALQSTQAGANYKDVTGEGAHANLKLSQFVAKGYVLVDFWASWCGPCRRAMPDLKKVYAKYHQKGLEIVGLSVWDEWDNHEKAVKALDLPWPQLFSPRATELYGVSGIPHIMLIDPNGKIVARNLHGEEAISKLLDAELTKNGGTLKAK